MDVTGLVFGVLGQVQLTIDWVKMLKEHRFNQKENRTLCGDLLTRFRKAKQTLDSLHKSEKAKHMSPVWKDYFEKMESCFEDFNKEFKPFEKGLKPSSEPSAFGRLRLRFHTFVKANKWMEVLKGLKEGLDELERDSMHLDGFATVLSELGVQRDATSNEFGTILDALKAQDAIVQSKLDVIIANQAQPATRDGTFRPTFDVPKNPKGVQINLDDPTTLEGALRKKILADMSTVVGAVGSRHTSDSAFAVKGLGGVGKTCALKAIGGDPKVQTSYSGGVYFFSLGQDVESADVIDMIAEIIEGTGGACTASKVKEKGKVSFAMRAGGKWFNGKRCLFICDDLWRTKDKQRSYLHDFDSLIPIGSTSSLLFSTRDLGIGEGLSKEQAVIFAERGDDEASSILCSYASISSVGSEALDSFNFVLKKCGGLPVALAVAGRAIKVIAKSSGEIQAWGIYKKRLQSSGATVANVIKRQVDGYSGLFTALSASLEGAGHLAETEVPCAADKINESFRALCVLRKQAWIPQSALSCLWRMSEERVEEVAELMDQLSLLNIERRNVNGKSVLGIKLHDLVHEFCLLESRKLNEVSQWNSKLLDGYKAKYSSLKTGQHGDDDGYRWWLLEEDHYLHANLAHHFAESGRWLEFQGLLLNFKWTCRQLCLSGVPAIANEFQRLSEHLTSSSSSSTLEDGTTTTSPCIQKDEEEQAEEIGLIVGAIRLSWPRVTQEGSEYSVRELGFQMHGRLCELGLRFPLMKKYLGSVDEAIEKPWAKPIKMCLDVPSGSKGAKFHMGGGAQAVSLIPNSNHVIAADNGGRLCIFDIVSAEKVRIFEGHKRAVSSLAICQDGRKIVSGSWDNTVRIWDMGSGTADREPLEGHDSGVSSVAVSQDGLRIVSGSSDKTVRIWDLKKGVAVGKPLKGHKEGITSVAMSGDGQRIVSGSWDKTVRIWDMKTGTAVGQPLKGHTCGVTSVVVSGDGQRIVSGSSDNTVRIWDMETQKAAGEPLRGHEFYVSSVAVTRDGRKIVSGSYDNTVRIWDAKKGVAVGEPLRGHEKSVLSVAVSGDGGRIMSGSSDNTVRIWDMETGIPIGKPLRQHEFYVTSVAASGDGKRIVSGSRDNVVRIWDMETGMAVGEPLRGHEGGVTSVTVSQDGERIVSGSSDKSVRIWDMKTGMAVWEPLKGHEFGVTSVAVSVKGQLIVSGSSDKTVRIWDMKAGAAIGEPLKGHNYGVTSVAVSEEGQRIVSGSSDKTVRIWDIGTGKAVGDPLRGHDDAVMSVAVSGNGRRIVSKDTGGESQWWDIKTGKALEVEEDLKSGDLGMLSGWREGLFCEQDRDAVYYGYIEGAKQKQLKMGSFDSTAREWVIDAKKKLWAVLSNGKLVIVSLVE